MAQPRSRRLFSFRIPPEKVKLPPYHPDTPEIRHIVPAEALGYRGEAEAALATLGEVARTAQPYEVLAALNTLEYVWRAGHAPLARVQALVRELKLSEPADRISRYLLSVK